MIVTTPQAYYTPNQSVDVTTIAQLPIFWGAIDGAGSSNPFFLPHIYKTEVMRMKVFVSLDNKLVGGCCKAAEFKENFRLLLQALGN